MAKQYWVGEFFVDLSRNQISQQSQAQTLPPKALLVLTYLAEHRGRVISYDELLDQIWPDSVVTPNTLQRSIAQLRKALGENSKASNVIKTHAKQGYSLECEVTWFTDKNVKPEPENGQRQEVEPAAPSREAIGDRPQPFEADTKVSAKRSLQAILVTAIALCVLGVISLWPVEQSSLPVFGELRYLTATDDKEFGAMYSPDGRFILFRRYYERLCINHIWAKNADTLEEFQLTSERGTHDAQSLSPDGRTLAYIKQEDCSKPVTQDKCYKLMSMDFYQALEGPQNPTELLHCQNTAIRSLAWVDDQHVAMLQKEAHRWRLIRFSVTNRTSHELYALQDGNILTFTYSPDKQRFAVTVLRDGGRHDLDILAADGTLISSHPVQIPADAPRHLVAYPTFIPDSDMLFFTFGGIPYSLTETGEVAKLDFPFEDRAGGPKFHPSGERLLLIKGRYDSDVGRLPLDALEDPNSSLTFSVIERSVELEDMAKFEPQGDKIAMISERTATEQVWLKNRERLSVFSVFPKGTFIRNLLWSEDGRELLVVADREIHRVSTDGDVSTIAFPDPVLNLYYWDSAHEKAIGSILRNGIELFGHLDLGSMTFTVITSDPVRWAVKAVDGPLIYMDHLNRFWREAGIDKVLLEKLAGQGSTKRFVVRDMHVFGVNRDDQLWRYDLASDQFDELGAVSKNLDYLTDVNDTALLGILLVAEKKEVVELQLH